MKVGVSGRKIMNKLIAGVLNVARLRFPRKRESLFLGGLRSPLSRGKHKRDFFSKSVQCFLLMVFAVLTLFPAGLRAQENDAFRSTDYPLPRFVSLASDKVFLRAGPGAQFPVKWEYHRKSLPVEIVLEFDVWRKIKDMDGSEGWVHQSMLSGTRTVLITGQEPVGVRRKPSEKARLVAYMEPEVIAALHECQPDWCRVESSGYKGWVSRASLWGVYKDEVVE